MGLFGKLGLGTADLATAKTQEIDKLLGEIIAARRGYEAAQNDRERGKHAQKMADLGVRLHSATGALCLTENGTTGKDLPNPGGMGLWR